MNLEQFGFRADYDEKNRIVKQEYIKQNEKEYFVSTIDLGIDHSSFGACRPLYFETMIFKKDSWNDLYCNRYETREEALKAHINLIESIQKNEFIIEN